MSSRVHWSGFAELAYVPTPQSLKGNYTINDDGSICVVFTNGFKRCDTIVTDGSSFALINAQGTRYPATVR